MLRQGKRTEIPNSTSIYPGKAKSYYMEQLNELLCRRNTNIIKENMNIIVSIFKSKKTFTIHVFIFIIIFISNQVAKGSNVKNGLKVKQLAKQPPTLKTLMQ